jgi:hypothetical protein
VPYGRKRRDMFPLLVVDVPLSQPHPVKRGPQPDGLVEIRQLPGRRGGQQAFDVLLERGERRVAFSDVRGIDA